jgi:hypothetical protein
LDPRFFAFCSPHSASLTLLHSGFNIQFLRCLKAPSIHVIALSIPGINAEAFRAGLVNRAKA